MSMSSPTTEPTISVQLDTVEALAAELAILSSQLADDAARCRSGAAALFEGLARDVGWAAGSAATAWATLTGIVADRTDAVAGTLVAAVASYRAADAQLADGMERASVHRGDGP
jgi:hypothetical protein